jgi:hypothetical protein
VLEVVCFNLVQIEMIQFEASLYPPHRPLGSGKLKMPSANRLQPAKPNRKNSLAFLRTHWNIGQTLPCHGISIQPRVQPTIKAGLLNIFTLKASNGAIYVHKAKNHVLDSVFYQVIKYYLFSIF